jgi:alkylhydroperoxidase family enzyme
LVAKAGKDPQVLDALAAAYAELGRYDEARKAAEAAERLVTHGGQSELAEQIHMRLDLYRSGTPYRMPSMEHENSDR